MFLLVFLVIKKSMYKNKITTYSYIFLAKLYIHTRQIMYEMLRQKTNVFVEVKFESKKFNTHI